MDYDKLIERLHKEAYGSDIEELLLDATTAIETFRIENAKLKDSRDRWKKCAEDFSAGVEQRDREDDALQEENEKLRADLARVTAERDTIEQDFRVFTKQWWEEANGFPCRFCKFENSGGCEQKEKHTDDEKPCAGRWFEWRGRSRLKAREQDEQ